MAQQVTINVRADVSEAQESIQNAIAELRGLAQAANEGSTIAQNAFRAEAAEIKAFATSLGATRQQLDQINTTTQQFETRVSSMDRTVGRAASSGARSFSILATQTAISTRSMDQLIGSVANLALGMTGAAGFVAAGAIALFGIARAFNEAQIAAEKLRTEMDKLAFDDNLSESLSKQHELQLQQIEDMRKLSEESIKTQLTYQILSGTGPFGILAATAMKVIGEDPASRAKKALDELTTELTQVNALVDKQAAADDFREKSHAKVLADEEAAHKRLVALRQFEAALARETAEQDKQIAKFAQALPHDMHFANEQGVDALAGGAMEDAPGSRTRPIRVSAPKIDYAQMYIDANGKIAFSFLKIAGTAQETFEKIGGWSGIAATSLADSFAAATDAIVSGKGNLKQVEQALAAPWIKSLEARAEYDFAMAATNWMNPPIAAKYLGSAALDLAGAAAISRILGMGGSSAGGHAGGSSGGASSAQLGAGAGSVYQQPILKVVVTGDLTMDGRTVATLNGKLQRVNDRGAPIRAVL